MTQQEKTLIELTENLEVIELHGDSRATVSGIQHDSRRVSPGDVFVAIEGLEADGHRFLPDAASRGASAAVVSRPVDTEGFQAVVRVANTRSALARISASLWDHPSRELQLVGITGTNGKTTLTYLLEQIFSKAGGVPGVVGTVNARYQGHQEDLKHTTPEASELQAMLHRMKSAGVTHVALEVSSHALELERVRGCHFRTAVFTNLSRDHLDFHGDLNRYAQAKSLLFSREMNESLAAEKQAVVNFDDPRSRDILSGWSGEVISFGFKPEADVHPQADINYTLEGTDCRVATPAGPVALSCRLAGHHNLYNALAAMAVSLALGIEPGLAAAGIAACRSVPGRLERVSPDRPAVFVDYSHTDQALANVISALRPLCRGRILVVFGCGGDRDRGKRPLMGAEVARGADLAIVTSDNPRTEDPQAIIEAILPGMDGQDWSRVEPGDLGQQSRGQYAVIADRREAIVRAVRMAEEPDVVLIAGKGHENYQIIGTTRLYFDDREEGRGALKMRESR